MKVKELSKIALVAALYVVATFALSAFSFGAVQFRLAETFNHLASYNKRYIFSVTLGCIIANMFSPLGPIDALVGGGFTFCTLVIVHWVSKRIESENKRLAVNTLILTVSMITVAIEMYFMLNLPILITYATLAIGEAVSMTVGGLLIKAISKRVDLYK